MKKEIHPKYYKNSTTRCACGAVFHIPSTREKMDVEICSQCHPFYTGKSKIVDAAGQVDKFKKRLERTQELQKKKKK